MNITSRLIDLKILLQRSKDRVSSSSGEGMATAMLDDWEWEYQDKLHKEIASLEIDNIGLGGLGMFDC